MRKFIIFLYEIARDSFHGTLRFLEIGEAVLAALYYAIGFFFHEIHESMGMAFAIFVLTIMGTFIVRIFVAAYRRDRRLAAEKDELDKLLQELRTPKAVIVDEVEAGIWNHHYRIIVENVSNITTEHVGVLLIRSEPSMNHLPIPLHCSHLVRPNSAGVDLDPGVQRKFDVFRFGSRQPGSLDVAGAAVEDVIPLQKYNLTLRIHGRNIPALDKDFIFEPQSDGKFAFNCVSKGETL